MGDRWSPCTLSTGCVEDVELRPGRKKAETNRKHGTEFVDEVIVFDDVRGITLVDEHPTEERYVTLGMDGPRSMSWPFRTRSVATTFESISARGATRRERAQYEDERI
jgi:uncharacterized DUF497 family protein